MSDTPQYRPTLHFTPMSTWMNDPNGLIRHKGLYHLFFQNNPDGRTWGNIGWGHAVSSDLVEWEELPVAIPATAEEMAFSGSVVWDRHNTSGLGDGREGPLVALFTSSYTPAHPERAGQQAQSLAYSVDDGLTWTRYHGNPVLDRGSADFRDPKVSWHAPTRRWVMVTVEAVDRQVLIFSSPNLIDWTHESSVGPLGEPGLLWECPDLIEVPVEGLGVSRWVLLLSTNPGGFAGGSGMQYLVGDFDGAAFTPGARGLSWFDHGPDMYAAVSFQGTEQPTVLGWMSNWAYANETPTHPWQSAMTLPHTLTLVPADGGPALRHAPVLPAVMPSGTHRVEFEFLGVGEIALETGEDDAISRFVLRRLPDGDLQVDRSGADPHGVHAGIHVTPPIPLPPGPVAGLLVEDHGLIEVFLDGGRVAVTSQTFPHVGPVRVTSSGLAEVSSSPVGALAR
ncbi:glycoside hydrolase family 32 protein [Tessaracoccus sp. MC1679]|uniref:glycoside hydrolase family 32 protein n=1 Tax=unclassified Tessaracoccus TaxID=2635419 RepID=UPI001603CDDA|nr:MULTISPECIES: glycoside hydrolase family 32 protein [unclassified Tessaracoccus]MBB1513375.1 glycoside hydrolase family 32 protein [Tessaracoccus sp. MC1627]MBB1515374.1 glycoside hydrolase family 32 protein [Tessaracoccus sp. MC1679]